MKIPVLCFNSSCVAAYFQDYFDTMLFLRLKRFRWHHEETNQTKLGLETRQKYFFYNSKRFDHNPFY